MALDELKTIAQHFMQAWSAGGEKIVDSLAAPDITVSYSHFPAPIHSAEQFKEILRQTHSSFPNLHLTVEEIFGEGNQIAVRWSYRGTHRHGDVLGITPTGKSVHVSGISFLKINNGKVTEERGIVDNFTLLQQLSTDTA